MIKRLFDITGALLALLLLSPVLPGDELGGFIDVTAGNYGLWRTDFGVDVPVLMPLPWGADRRASAERAIRAAVGRA